MILGMAYQSTPTAIIDELKLQEREDHCQDSRHCMVFFKGGFQH